MLFRTFSILCRDVLSLEEWKRAWPIAKSCPTRPIWCCHGLDRVAGKNEGLFFSNSVGLNRGGCVMMPLNPKDALRRWRGGVASWKEDV